jgi:hypothetical protein
MTTPIDVWDVETFDQELISMLHANAQLIGDYLKTANRSISFSVL